MRKQRRLKKSFLFSSGMVVLLAASYYAAKTFTIHQIADAGIRVVPFVLEQEIYLFGSDQPPNGELSKRHTMARRSDGTTAEIDSVGALQWGRTVRKVTHMDGYSVTLLDWLSGKSTWQRETESQRAARKQSLLHPRPDCSSPDQTFKRFDTVADHRVAVVEQGLANYRITAWEAPDLACAPLAYRAEQQQPDGSFRVTSDARLVSLTLSEPDLRYFDEGSDYSEYRPSNLIRQALQKLGIHEDEKAKNEEEQADTAYTGKR